MIWIKSNENITRLLALNVKTFLWFNFIKNRIIKRIKTIIDFGIGCTRTAGHGVKVNERFSDIIKNELQDYEVINLGVNGSNSKEQFSTLKNYLGKEKRDVPLLVYQYFGNHIEKSYKENKTFF